MSLKQLNYLFNYNDFQKTVAPLVKALEKDDSRPLQEYVTEVRGKFNHPGEWILNDVGTSLNGDFGFDRDLKYQNALWGNWLLIVLSDFLHQTPSLNYKWTKLSKILETLGWNEEDRWLLIAGHPTSLLVKPQATHLRGMALTYSDPFWFWISPPYSTYCGWLSLEDINRLDRKLQIEKNNVVDNMEFSAKVSISLSEVNLIWGNVMRVVKEAVNTDKGIFLVTYIDA